jgi:dTDP-glucose 4,6-dehydratase
LAVWLWTMLIDGRAGRAYNVGSDSGIPIAALARLVAAQVAPAAEVRVACPPTLGKPQERYVPDTSRARTELGLSESVGLEDALRRTAAWARARAGTNS